MSPYVPDRRPDMRRERDIERAAYATTEDGERVAVFDTSAMSSPVMCQHCRRVYDLVDVEVIGRYGDCDTFNAPCCHRAVDTRPWKSLPDYHKLPRGRRVTEWDAR